MAKDKTEKKLESKNVKLSTIPPLIYKVPVDSKKALSIAELEQ